MSTRIITPPDELITVAQAAAFMRLDSYASESDVISAITTASRQWCEEYLNRAIGPQTLETIRDGFPIYGKRGVTLRSPLISLTSVKYLDTSNTEQTLTLNTDFFLDDDSDQPAVRPYSTWPVALGISNSVKVRYTAGYNDPSESPNTWPLPKTIRQAMLMLIADMYENREAQSEKPLTANRTIENLLSMYRLEMGI